jgi:hypothetical protein
LYVAGPENGVGTEYVLEIQEKNTKMSRNVQLSIISNAEHMLDYSDFFDNIYLCVLARLAAEVPNGAHRGICWLSEEVETRYGYPIDLVTPYGSEFKPEFESRAQLEQGNEGGEVRDL